MRHTFTLDYWKDGRWYVGKLQEVPGVFSQGKSLSELEKNIREAYKLMLQENSENVSKAIIKTKSLAIAV
ncbi:MAG: type II toxin-antitoxin system HicB family antitoxin [Ignavibacteriales bacterium]|nr:type II toxin-antitoxin system HicB family antitoxin [Ignavibacteriales bacterium]